MWQNISQSNTRLEQIYRFIKYRKINQESASTNTFVISYDNFYREDAVVFRPMEDEQEVFL